MEYKEVALKLYNDLCLLDETKITLVSYDTESKILGYIQENAQVYIPYMSRYFLHREFKIGVLIPGDLLVILDNLKVYISASNLKELNTQVSLRDLGFDIHGINIGTMTDEPRLVSSVTLVSATSKLPVFLCWLMYKSFRNLYKIHFN